MLRKILIKSFYNKKFFYYKFIKKTYKIIFPINLLNKYNNKILYLRFFNLIVNLKIHIYILLNTLTMQDILIIPSDI